MSYIGRVRAITGSIGVGLGLRDPLCGAGLGYRSHIILLQHHEVP